MGESQQLGQPSPQVILSTRHLSVHSSGCTRQGAKNVDEYIRRLQFRGEMLHRRHFWRIRIWGPKERRFSADGCERVRTCASAPIRRRSLTVKRIQHKGTPARLRPPVGLSCA